ncbi:MULTISPECIES: hypothetical protein [Pseudofrankia]|uniref:hypothetical protein n=1 Tax=Pseudofrankia TaxID=2994363 RepID=UPI000234B9C5|nr:MULTISPECIES: hypothetical protein [Pseudofrankia]OHV30045.1 hypothetical protein BCD49_34750 [Pseudofrankia sp. EUN1h]
MRRLTRYARIVTLIGFVAAIGAVGCSETTGATSLTSSGTVAPADSTNAPADIKPPAEGPTLSAQIALDMTSVAQGGQIAGTLTVTNRSTEAIGITEKNGCHPAWTVGLQRPGMPVQFAYTLMCELRPLVFPPGTTSFDLSIRTTYISCSSDESTSVAGSSLPRCENGEAPPFPIGDYEAVVVSNSPDFPRAAAIGVRVVAR